MKPTNELVTLFWQDGRPVGLLLLNGHAEFFRISKANKEYISELLGANKVDDK
jgi:hypothetical protein